MAHIGSRSIKIVEAPRPLKSQTRSLKNNFMIIEELIALIERVAASLQSGINDTESITTLAQNLRVHGPQLESVSKDTLDRAFVVFRNSSQDERLNIMTRLNLLELIELRAKSWEDNGINAYYKTKQATNIELNDGLQSIDSTLSTYLSTSPTIVGGIGSNSVVVNAIGASNQQQLLLGPGEIIRNSGKFSKPTRIPGKTYCKDEVVIRNADSGKVMGIKGRRVHMIEELSETVISFQRVNPGARERLVQITGPSEEKINYAKHLIEDTIRRNASPVRLDMTLGNTTVANGNSGVSAGGDGSCSSLASSNSDEVGQTRAGSNVNTSSIMNRINFTTNQSMSVPTPIINNNVTTSNTLLHSYSTSDASLGEYKFTCNVGQHVIKITGDCCDLVRAAKLVLDDYFSSSEFLASFEIGASFDGSASSASVPLIGATFNSKQSTSSQLINNNNNSKSNNNINHDGDDDVFVDGKATLNNDNNNNNGIGVTRTRRSHFSRKDSSIEAVKHQLTQGSTSKQLNSDNHTRIVYQYEHLLYYAKSPHSWALPADWQEICEKFPAIIRNQVNSGQSGSLSRSINHRKASPSLLYNANNHKHALRYDDDTQTPSTQELPSITIKPLSSSNVTNSIIDLTSNEKSNNLALPSIAYKHPTAIATLINVK